MENYENLGKIGEGTYGVVLKCRHRTTGQIVAIKKFKEADNDEQVRKTAMREVKLLKQCKHTNVVELIEVFRRKQILYLVFDYVERTVLEDLEAKGGGMTMLDVKKTLYQLLKAIHFCHSQNIIHRDIKPENILLSKDGVLKLCDFGFARSWSMGLKLSPYVSTRWYRAPELLVGDVCYGPGVDIWSVGCMFVEMLTGIPIFPGESDVDQLWLIYKCVGKLTAHHEELRRKDKAMATVRAPASFEHDPLQRKYPQLRGAEMAFLAACLHYDPAQRPSCAQLLQSPFFHGIPQLFGEGEVATRPPPAGSPVPPPRPSRKSTKLSDPLSPSRSRSPVPPGPPSPPLPPAAAVTPKPKPAAAPPLPQLRPKSNRRAHAEASTSNNALDRAPVPVRALTPDKPPPSPAPTAASTPPPPPSQSQPNPRSKPNSSRLRARNSGGSSGERRESNLSLPTPLAAPSAPTPAAAPAAALPVPIAAPTTVPAVSPSPVPTPLPKPTPAATPAPAVKTSRPPETHAPTALARAAPPPSDAPAAEAAQASAPRATEAPAPKPLASGSMNPPASSRVPPLIPSLEPVHDPSPSPVPPGPRDQRAPPEREPSEHFMLPYTMDAGLPNLTSSMRGPTPKRSVHAQPPRLSMTNPSPRGAKPASSDDAPQQQRRRDSRGGGTLPALGGGPAAGTLMAELSAPILPSVRGASNSVDSRRHSQHSQHSPSAVHAEEASSRNPFDSPSLVPNNRSKGQKTFKLNSVAGYGQQNFGRSTVVAPPTTYEAWQSSERRRTESLMRLREASGSPAAVGPHQAHEERLARLAARREHAAAAGSSPSQSLAAARRAPTQMQASPSPMRGIRREPQGVGYGGARRDSRGRDQQLQPVVHPTALGLPGRLPAVFKYETYEPLSPLLQDIRYKKDGGLSPLRSQQPVGRTKKRA